MYFPLIYITHRMGIIERNKNTNQQHNIIQKQWMRTHNSTTSLTVNRENTWGKGKGAGSCCHGKINESVMDIMEVQWHANFGHPCSKLLLL